MARIHQMGRVIAACVLASIPLATGCAAGGSTPDSQGRETALSSWNHGATRDRLIAFIGSASDPASSGYIPEAERIAVFDNDGTLWAERPVYFQLLFALDRVREMAADHPEWATAQPFQAAIEGDMKALAESGKEGLVKLVMATHAGMTTDEFATAVRDWVRTARHPESGQPYTAMTYAPMLELLGYLRSNGFKTYIVSGGGVEFMRVFAQEVYGIPPEQVIGTTIKTEFEMTATGPVIRREAEIDFIDDKAGKPVSINRFIGRRPVLAFGNSDGDHEMLQWTAAGDGPRLVGLVHHTDAAREWAYDREGHVGRLDAALDEANDRGWLVVDMARDWDTVFATPLER
ncbi:MAG: HAD family hydrolase [Planctomycetota bacterium]